MIQQFRDLFGTWLLAAFCCWLTLCPVQGKSLKPTQDNAIMISVNLNSTELKDSLLSIINSPEKDSTKSKVIAAILAVPPLGWFGFHRLYLGANPIIPILYFVTFGGAVGILPFIDMMVIILSKDTKPFYKNSKILMWYKKSKKKSAATPQ